MFKLCLMILSIISPAVAAAQTAPPPAPPEEVFSPDAAGRVLHAFREALITQDRARTLALFDSARMPGYAEFADSLGVLFQQNSQKYLSVRVGFHLLQTNDETGAALVDFTLEALPVRGEEPPLRHRDQLRFTFARAGKKWKIIDVQPRSFFAGF
jgi:hypothetical protein